MGALTPPIDIDIGWNTQDATGLPWTFVDQAATSGRYRQLKT